MKNEIIVYSLLSEKKKNGDGTNLSHFMFMHLSVCGIVCVSVCEYVSVRILNQSLMKL